MAGSRHIAAGTVNFMVAIFMLALSMVASRLPAASSLPTCPPR